MRGRHQRAGISHSFLTDWPDGAGPWHLCQTPSRALTCGYGFRRTGRMPSIDLRIRRLGVRVPPSAPAQRPVPTLGPAFRVLRTQRSTATLTATAVHPGASPPWSSSWSSQSLSRRSASLVTLSGDLGVDLHCERDPAVPEDGHRDARVNVERGRERAAGTTGVVERDAADVGGSGSVSVLPSALSTCL